MSFFIAAPEIGYVALRSSDAVQDFFVDRADIDWAKARSGT
jgi:hypothetical protein